MTARRDALYQPTLEPWQSAWRYGLALLLTLLMALPEALRPTDVGLLVLDIIVGVVGFGVVHYRRRWPLAVALTVVAGSAVSLLIFGPFVLAMVSVSTRRRWRELAVVLVAMIISIALSFLFVPTWAVVDHVDGWQGTWQFAAASNLAIVAIIIGWGLYIGSRRELVWTLDQRAARAERAQVVRAEQARDAERARIAREMHDVLAHRISQISMQAGAIAFRDDLDADALRTSARALQANANAALVDLRGVLGVLRDPDSGASLTAPQPRSGDIDSLISGARAEGARIEYSSTIEPGLNDTIGRTLYRITQECITNATKHAPGTLLTIDIAGSSHTGVDFRAHNPMALKHSSGEAVPASGYGLIGLTERAELVGGTLTVQPSGRAFAISCHLPWEPDATRLPEYSHGA